MLKGTFLISNALNLENYLFSIFDNSEQLAKCFALPVNPVVHEKISGELFDFVSVQLYTK